MGDGEGLAMFSKKKHKKILEDCSCFQKNIIKLKMFSSVAGWERMVRVFKKIFSSVAGWAMERDWPELWSKAEALASLSSSPSNKQTVHKWFLKVLKNVKLAKSDILASLSSSPSNKQTNKQVFKILKIKKKWEKYKIRYFALPLLFSITNNCSSWIINCKPIIFLHQICTKFSKETCNRLTP